MNPLRVDYPPYLSAKTQHSLTRSAMLRRWGVLNIYRCEVCSAEIMTVDLDEGTTPMMTRCHVQKCQQYAISAMYRVLNSDRRKPTHAWYRPDSLEGMEHEKGQHLMQGGLILRPLTQEEFAILVEPISEEDE